MASKRINLNHGDKFSGNFIDREEQRNIMKRVSAMAEAARTLQQKQGR
ncbi:MAG: hypothetical protein UU45_C0008G0098 [Candidatus Levybacteria bacterium GW2011_GWA2_41_15]|nr:MAG: hypothetical protein UU45_C0008G0098 [Candidatus Levybacteria bacterium GW2011_GWA2_41_15]